MNLKNKLYLYFGLIFITYAAVGGLLLPLAPNIEAANFTNSSDSVLTFDVKAPKAHKSDNQFFLVKNSFAQNEKWILAANNKIEKNGLYSVSFENPSFSAENSKGQSFDLWMQNKIDGAMVYFSAYTIDSIRGNKVVKLENQSVLKSSKEFKWAFPNRPILRESIRNLFFHVPMWFGMMAMLAVSLIFSILFLYKSDLKMDHHAVLAAEVGLLFGTLGILTGMVWARYTWGAFWTDDPKLNGAAIGMLIYLAYMILRGSLTDPIQRAKLSGVYNIFAFSIYFVFIYILPRMKSSLHPGNGGNPGFNIYEQDNTMRLFFYPAVIGWILIGLYLKNWRASLNK